MGNKKQKDKYFNFVPISFLFADSGRNYQNCWYTKSASEYARTQPVFP